MDSSASPEPGRTATFAILLAVAVLGVAATCLPLWQPLFLALVLAGTLGRVQERLARRLHGRGFAAGLLIILLVIVVLLPVTWIVVVTVREVIAVAQSVVGAVQHGGVTGLVDLAPSALRPWIERQIHDEPQWASELVTRLPTQGLALVTALGGALSATGTLAFNLVMMLIALYFFLVEGPRLARWICAISPLGAGRTGVLLESVRSTSSGVLFSAFATAAVQSVVAWIGFQIARVPESLFFAALTFFAAFIPSVGTSLVGIPLALYLILSGRWVAGIFIAAWTFFLTGTIDNALKPWIAGGRAALNGGVVFFAMVGGILMFGPLGLVVGPAAVALLLALIRLGRGELGPPPVEPVNETAPRTPAR